MTPDNIAQQIVELLIAGLAAGMVALAGGPLWAVVMTFAIVGACISWPES